MFQRGVVHSGSCVLAVTNAATAEINRICTNQFLGSSFVCYSADTAYDPDDSCRYPVEFLNSLSVPGIPDHCLVLKTGMPVILLRNLSPKTGLCNGVRLVVQEVIDSRIVAVKFANGSNSDTFYIPRINLIVNETAGVPLKWRRRQFPLRQAFSLTINKVQGQTLSRVGVWLEIPVFTHGQLYTAASRINNPDNIRFFILNDCNLDSCSTQNIVFREVID